MKGNLARFLVGCALVACAACAGSAETRAPAASPPSAPEPSPAAPPVAQSKSAYPSGSSNDATTPSAAGAAMAPQTESMQAAPSSAPPQAPAMAPTDTSRDRAEASQRGAGDLARAEREIANGDCATACRALGSMERAVAFICMQSQGDDGSANRCADARTRLVASRRRVRSSCGSCAGGPSVDPDAPVPSTR